MTCLVQNICKWLFICPSILFYWILLDDAKLQISFPVQGWAKTTIFFMRRGVSFKLKWSKTTIVDKRSVGTLTSIYTILVHVFYFGICLFGCWGYVVGSIYRLDRVLKFLYTKLNLSMFLFEPPENLTYFDPLKMNIKNPKVITKT